MVETQRPFCRLEIFLQFPKPGRMGKVAGGNDRDAFDPTPGINVREGERGRARARVLGVDVEIEEMSHNLKTQNAKRKTTTKNAKLWLLGCGFTLCVLTFDFTHQHSLERSR